MYNEYNLLFSRSKLSPKEKKTLVLKQTKMHSLILTEQLFSRPYKLLILILCK